MSLKFKGNKSVTDIMRQTQKGKSAQSVLQKKAISKPQGVYQAERKFKHEKKQRVDQKDDNEDEIQQQIQQQQQQITSKVQKTQAQMSYELIQKKRMAERINQKLKESYRQKVDKFNDGLSKQTDHNDIPKVGPG